MNNRLVGKESCGFIALIKRNVWGISFAPKLGVQVHVCVMATAQQKKAQIAGSEHTNLDNKEENLKIARTKNSIVFSRSTSRHTFIFGCLVEKFPPG